MTLGPLRRLTVDAALSHTTSSLLSHGCRSTHRAALTARGGRTDETLSVPAMSSSAPRAALGRQGKQHNMPLVPDELLLPAHVSLSVRPHSDRHYSGTRPPQPGQANSIGTSQVEGAGGMITKEKRKETVTSRLSPRLLDTDLAAATSRPTRLASCRGSTLFDRTCRAVGSWTGSLATCCVSYS